MMDDVTSRFTVDLANCAREPIHQSGAIQPFGFLLAFASDWTIVHVSENVGAFCGRTSTELLGQPALGVLNGEALHAIRTRLQWLQTSDASERLFRVDLLGDGRGFDVAIHVAGPLIVVEAEPSGALERVEAVSLVRTMMVRLRQATTYQTFLEQAARQVRALTGFDRVMVYRFLDDGSGEVVAEATARWAASYKGLRYPATDIPEQARALYLRNTFRIIADVNAVPVPVVPGVSPEGRPVDLSLSVLRSVSPIHIEYLKNMGVAASLSISIIVDGRLWGLFACHHLSPRQVGFDRRTAAELFGDMLSLELENRERLLVVEARQSAEAARDRVLAMLPAEGSVVDTLSAALPSLAALIPADGCGLWVEGRWIGTGKGPSEEEARALVRFLNRTEASRVFATAELPRLLPEAVAWEGRVAGVLAVPVARSPRDYLIYTREEVQRTVTWAGNPDKAVETEGTRLSPRRSFEAWREEVRGTSAPWLPHELALAGELRPTLLEAVVRGLDRREAARRPAPEAQQLLMSELNHGVRNILGTLQGVVRRTATEATTVEAFAEALRGRIDALARVHDQLVEADWQAAPLARLVATAVGAYGPADEGGVVIEGPEVALAAPAANTLALVLHELATRSVAGGALGEGPGRLVVTWSLDAMGALELTWHEEGAAGAAPARFGSALLERAVPYELGGEAAVELRPDGFSASFLVPARHVRTVEGLGEGEAPPVSTSPRPASGERVLLVEDNLIIAMDAEAMLLDLGFREVAVANTAAAGLERIAAGGVTCAILDINLGGELSFPVAERLLELGTPFVFASGYGDPEVLPPSLRHVPILTKPYAEGKVVEALGVLRLPG